MKKRNLILVISIIAVILIFIIFLNIFSKNEPPIIRETISGKLNRNDETKGDAIVNLYLKKGYGIRFMWEDEPYRTKNVGNQNEFSFENLPDSLFYIWAYIDENNNGNVDYNLNEPTGWYSHEDGAPDELNPFQVSESPVVINFKKLNILNSPQKTRNGALKIKKGLKILKLNGKPYDRGYAHGSILADQIIDMIRYFNIEFGAKSAKRYDKVIIPYVEKYFTFEEKYIQELSGILDGMKESGSNLMIPEINREININDLKALNTYGEWLSLGCSSVSAWGRNTNNTELRRGMIIGRNMDGEIDLRKATIHHLIIYAVTPYDDNKYSWISVMWPGFIGTYSGMNEEGLGIYTHKGNTDAGLPVTGFTPKGIIVKDILENISKRDNVNKIRNIIVNYEQKTGGALGIGNILHIVFPYLRQPVPAAIFEDDYKGGATRYPGEYEPKDKNVLLCCNTFIKYSVNSPQIGINGRRYSALIKKLRQILENEKRTIDTKTMIEIIQISSSNRTEHAIIFKPNLMEVEIAVEDLENGIREATKTEWKSFKWEEFFN